MPSPRTRRNAAGTAGLLALGLLAGCGADESAWVQPDPPAGLVAEPGGDFESHEDLWESVKSKRFADRAKLVMPKALRPVPEPLRVPFISGTELPEGQIEPLGDLAERIRSDSSLLADVTGCSDSSGPAALNKRISQRRAETIAAELERRGVPAEQLGAVVGRGEECEEQERMVHVTPKRVERDGQT